MIYNRLYINYRELKTNGELLKAKYYLKQSKEYVTNLKMPSLKDEFSYLNISDEGYDFYCLYETKDTLLSIWEQCMEYPPARLPQKAMNYFRKCIQIYLIKHQPLDALEKITEAVHYMSINPSSANEKLVFSFSFSLYKIMALTIQDPIKNKRNLMAELEICYQLSELMGKKNWTDLLNLHAIICFYNKDADGVYYYFKESYEAYNLIKSSLHHEQRQKLLLDNIYTGFSKFKMLQKIENFLSPEDVDYIKNKTAQDRCYQARGIQRTSDNLFNLPSI
jgi:hypothetical protein